MKWTVGVGMTNECNLNCPHCYSRENGTARLSLEDIRLLTQHLSIRSINFGTGESGLHPEFPAVIAYLHERQVDMSLTSNGYTLSSLSDSEIQSFHDVDVSIDFPTKTEHERFRGRGTWDRAMDGIRRCLDLGVDVSAVMCLMNNNYHRIPEILELVGSYGINLRINIYKPVHTRKFELTYEQFWDGMGNLFKNSEVISCSEPIVNAVLGMGDDRSGPCGSWSCRVRPDRRIVPCVYWGGNGVPVETLGTEGFDLAQAPEFLKIQRAPEECLSCSLFETCRGGCPSRRRYQGFEKPDRYCPVIRGEEIGIDYERAEKRDLIHAGYLCTLIVRSRS
jgi:radical SAM protein with 4Fe4S-binding SPASM domain